MVATSTLLCIHRNPAQLSPLQKDGYELVTATNGSEGLRLLMLRPVDAIVLEYHLGLLNGAVVAAEIKRVKPQLPIVMLADHADLPEGATQCVDAVVVKSRGIHSLGATIHFVLNVKLAKSTLPAQELAEVGSRQGIAGGEGDRLPAVTSRVQDHDAPFSPAVWMSILNGSIKF